MIDLNLPEKRKIIQQAPAWKRIISFMLDLMILNIIVFSPFSGVIDEKIPELSTIQENMEFISQNPDISSSLYTLLGVMFFFVFAYFVIFEYRYGQTPGKMIMKLYAVPINKKEEMGIMSAVLRNVALFPIFPFSVLWIIDPLFLIVSGKRLSDIFSKTTVVEERTI